MDELGNTHSDVSFLYKYTQVRNKETRENKLKPVIQEAAVERRATLEVEDANPSWDARLQEILLEMESCLQQSKKNQGRN